MLTYVQSLTLGAVQGLTEFLPISSSGHLILAREILHINTESGLAFDAVLQLGTTLAVLIYFRNDIYSLCLTFWRLVSGQKSKTSAQDKTLFFGILIGTIPALILGLLLEHTMETLFRSAILVALMLILGSLLFIAAERYARQKQAHPSLKQSWWIGVFQCLALVPGVSRSGSTISGGLLLGLTRESATRFSFLLSLPIIAGSGLLKLKDIIESPPQDFDRISLSLGFLASAIVGYAAIGWLIRFLKRNSLMPFVWYRLSLAVLVVLMLFFER
ncbi:undecaprenyl-diphosphatase UppP [Candidatus Uhrbacteria bacterium]|nr:undecaprenyl-diphosphatase UppP [Candidatus Uhrbacteria bacterium]